MKYVDVIVPLPIAGEYTYSLPPALEGKVHGGCRVVVPFGPKKYYTAIVVSVHDSAPEAYETKDILEVLDERPVLLKRQFDFWQWVSDYYLCTIGDVYKAALPSGLKLESETMVVYNPDFEASGPLPPKEQLLLDLLSANPEQCVTQLEKAAGIRNILPVVRSLLEKEAVCIKEELKRSYKPKTEIRVRLAGNMRTEKALQFQMNMLDRPKTEKQLAVLMKYVELSGWNGTGETLKEVSRKRLTEAAGVSPAVLDALVRKQVLEIYSSEVGRLDGGRYDTIPLNPLSEAQRRAFYQIMSLFQTRNVCLLHGVTASGKTEIYIHLIEQAIQAGKQVLYLLPEIALTTQITERLRRVFGERLGIYHSKFPDAERVEIWNKQLSDRDYDVILGVRSSVFLPFRRLGLVIVDEEHENTYKQQDPAPRYHARSAAIMLASMFGAKTLLGTATPSLESYHNALSGKYGFVQLTERHQQIRLPQIELVDIKELARKKRMTAQFSPYLLQKIREALENREQVILFQNRRGFAPMIECRTCGWVPKCRNCDVSLTYHKGLNQLTCHYCGCTYPVPRSCPACGGVELVNRGFGTEKVEDDIKAIFPEARVARMDLDTTRTRSAYERIISDFQNGKTDILIGTQMVSKGLDFDRVSVVGILNADSMLNYPDFRSYERAFQLMAQVAGRAGRKNGQGLVVLQTKSPDLPLIHEVMDNDYLRMYREQMEEREMFRYPPFYRLVYVYLKHRKEDVLDQAADWMAQCLRKGLGERILGPDKPPVARIQTLYIKKIVVKVEQQASMSKVRAYLRSVQQALMEDRRFRSLTVYYDVDPM
ncbi:primosomal protein N' [uncultured Bacteroides sp.]|jgi:primosomal protein N' (replication factor Y)|uniref:replication restart helicase PriA n=1 Tax=uncultured Bacteroides sp. TaxID=162156 RepID=UPI00280C1D37|nr:primosomal protein N' [uncultured Bacteroides sp.]